jgi:hypothetical protein
MRLDEVTSKKRAVVFCMGLTKQSMDLERLLKVERVVVFGRPAKVLADFRVNEYDKQRLKSIIQLLIEQNIPLETAQARFKL